MKPSDFFLGSRQFFGFLIPGVLWVTSIVLLLSKTRISDLLEFLADIKLAEALSFLASALVVGMLTQDRSFGFARWVSRKITNYEKKLQKQLHSRGIGGSTLRAVDPALSSDTKIGRIIWLRIQQLFARIGRRLGRWRIVITGEHLAPVRYRAALGRQAAQMIRERFVGARVPPRLYFDSEDKHYQGERQIFTICKRSVLARSLELGRILKEKEDEVNLVGMLPLPLIFLSTTLFLRAHHISNLPVVGNTLQWRWGLAITSPLLIVYLLIRFHHLRKEEFRVCLESFLLVESGLAKDSKAGDPTAKSESSHD
jgi:hypothetical protein